jgi:putative FmdB family regulatory protein
MPIYEYRCSDCGHQREFLQKVSDDPIKSCPKCSSVHFSKLLSAAGFQLKGSGWYATDFKNGSKPAAKSADKTKDETASPADANANAKEEKKPSGDAKPAGCGGACACHD